MGIKFKKRSLLKKISSKVIILNVLLLLFPITFFSNYSIRMNRESIIQQIHNDLTEMMMNLDQQNNAYLSELDGMIKTIYQKPNRPVFQLLRDGKYNYIYDEPLLQILQDGKYKFCSNVQIRKKNRIDDYLSYIVNQEQGIQGIYIFTNTGNLFYNSIFFVNETYSPKDKWYREIMKAGGEPVIFGAHKPWMAENSDQRTEVFSIGKELLTSDGKFLAIILMDMNISHLQDAINQYERHLNSDVFLFDSNGAELIDNIRSGKNHDSTMLRIIYKRSKSNKSIKIEGKLAYVTSIKSSVSGWKLVNVVYADSITNMLSPLRLNNDAILGIMIIWFIAFLWIVYRTIYIPLYNLRMAMGQVEKGDFNAYVKNFKDDEIGDLIKNYNFMLYEINQLISEKYILESKRRDAEFEALKLQMNPHFIINALQLISSIAIVNNDHEVDEVVKPFSHMVRYILYEDRQLVPLDMEITYVREYIQIQQKRRNENIQVDIQIEDDCRYVQIMKLMLQPLVENCFIHGFKQNQAHCRLNICVFQKKNRLFLSVRDNGVGMDNLTLQELHSAIRKGSPDDDRSKRKRLGLANIDKRMNDLFGSRGRLFIFSREQQGTNVILVMPLLVVQNNESH